MPIASARNYYQEGALDRVKRAKGPDAWVYRWRETGSGGKRVQRKRIIGTVDDYKTLREAKMASDNLRLAANAANNPTSDVQVEAVTVGTAWGHFQVNELSAPEIARSPTTIASYKDYFKSRILPTWRDVPLEDVKAVGVEKWLRSLKDIAPGTKAKIRNHMSSLFARAIRHELYAPRGGINPITKVRQSSMRRTEPDVLSLPEIRSILNRIEPPAIKMMVAVAAASGLRRSEVRGLKCKDSDLAGHWFNLKRGLVRKSQTNLKTEASRRGMPMLPQLAEALAEWRHRTPYNQPDDWVFASPFTRGERPYWPESALKGHVRPAALAAGIHQVIGWHTFRHSLATLMGKNKEDTKVVQELMRHASSRITLDVYQHGDEDAKRSALGHLSGLFDLPPKATSHDQ